MIGEIQKQDFQLTIGDSLNLTIKLKDSSGNAISFDTGDKIYFSAKKELTQTTYDIQKIIENFETDGSAILSLVPDDTKDLEIGALQYDLQWNKANGNKHTFLKGKIKLIEGVTNE